MRLADPKVWLGGLSLALVLALVWLDLGRTSPGPLATPHARVAELVGDAGCERCHATKTLADGCVVCHEDIGAQLATHVGFHGRTIPSEQDACARCHTEHHGDELALVGERAFHAAGVADVAAFRHEGLDFPLTGVHGALECKRCHAEADAPVLASGERRFLGLVTACASCHEDVHAGKFGLDCASCHGQDSPFTDVANFVHPASFPLVGGHARDCKACHDPQGPFAIELVREQPTRTCASCHASPHSERFVNGVAALTKIESSATCALCHDAARGRFEDDSKTMRADLHRASGFDLARPHERATCADCHASTAANFAERYPGRRADDCAACHGDPHGGEFARGAFASAQCVDCHAPESFAAHSFDVEAHGRTAFALTGAHARAKCDQCHAPLAANAGGPRDFRVAEQACAACHADAHRGEFALAAAARGEPAPGCAECHGTESFSGVDHKSFEHARRTSFALLGAHERASCESCHPVVAATSFLERRVAFASERFPGDPNRCDTCHVDVHDGVFDSKSGPIEVDGRATCARCHDVERFRGDAARGFDHGLFTGFALEGGHARASCEACHGKGGERALGRVREHFPGRPERCETCHADPHGGRFTNANAPSSIDGREGCARCHNVQSFGAISTRDFDHAQWTGFALNAAHASTACEACHVPTADAGGRTRLGRAAGATCAACHADPHAGQFVVAGSSDCAKCHVDAGSFAELVFDHDRDSRFPLDARHADLACAACHRPVEAGRGTSVTRYKPLGVECIDCHQPTEKQR